MAEIKAIETEYNGYRFRSRLETRWAVFFDALGIEYQYETEGFEAPTYNGQEKVFYLPDFYLPKINIYCEVKGTDKALFADSEKIGHMIDFNSSPVTNGLLILGEIPNPETFDWGNFPMFSYLYWHKGVVHDYASFLFVPRQGFTLVRGSAEIMKAVFSYKDPEGDTACIPQSASTKCCWTLNSLRANSLDHPHTKALIDAYKAARQARFEHGETPKIVR